MELKEILCDRAVFLLMFMGYVTWKNTTGPGHWAALVSKFGDFELVLLGTMVVSSVFYAAFSGIFALVDLVMLPKDSLYGVRLQPKKIPSWSLYKKALPVVIFNFTVLALPTGFGAYYYLHPASPRNTAKSTGLYPFLPPSVVLLRDVIICVLVEEVLFYYFHRLFHHPALYATFHKKHHEFTAPIGMSEAIINTVVTHGGYTFFGFPNADMHDFHHETFNNMFGVIGLLDYLHGTDLKFKERIAGARVKGN